jgi:type II secretory pathway pseudopilin PulG
MMQKGFALIELAIVFLIVGLLLGTVLPLLSIQHDNAQIADTQKRIIDARDALYGFALANGRLPCPASASSMTGIEVIANNNQTNTTNCTYAAGVLPWVTIGGPDVDAWGRRFTYRVTGEFARVVPQQHFNGTCNNGGDPPEPITIPKYASFALCSQGDLTIQDTKNGNTIAWRVPAVIISHGKNGYGAYTAAGTQLGSSSDPDEIKNQLTTNGTNTTDLKFVSKGQTATYDDLTAYLTTSLLFTRMAAVSKLP